MKITKFAAGSVATLVALIIAVAIYYQFPYLFKPRHIGNTIIFIFFLLSGVWMGIFLLLKRDGLKEEKIDVKGKDSDLE
jgi:hypothetical protein